MKQFWIIFLVLFIPSVCFPGPLQQAHKKAIAGQTVASGCASGTVDSDADYLSHTNFDASDALHLTEARGTSFQVSENGNIYSISVYISAHTVNGTITVRWGPDADLTSTYYDEATSDTITGISDIEVVMPDHDSITASTTYYIGVVKDSGTMSIGRDDPTANYPNGNFRQADSGWNMNNDHTTYDIIFNVKLCD